MYARAFLGEFSYFCNEFVRYCGSGFFYFIEGNTAKKQNKTPF